MKPQALASSLKKSLGNKATAVRVERLVDGAKTSNPVFRIWLSVKPAALPEAVGQLARISPDPHFSVISGCDLGKAIELIYHFTAGYGTRLGESSVSMRVALPKRSPEVPTITGIIPGALISEREVQEMLGVKVIGIPDQRRLFLGKDFPKGVYPWRKDASGPGSLAGSQRKGGPDG